MTGHRRRPWLKGSGHRRQPRRTAVAKVRYEALEATLDARYFPCVFPGRGCSPCLRAIWRPTATAHERASEVDWQTFRDYLVAHRLAIGIDRNGYAHTCRAPVEWDQGETARLSASERARAGQLEDDQARAWIAERERREEALRERERRGGP